MSTSVGLPWERNEGAPSGTGICLSGGGLRAASYAIGVLNALQRHRGLLYGPAAADFLSVVSGGSYAGATALLNADRATPQCPPLAPGSPELEHVARSGRYLIEGGYRSAWPFAWRFIVGTAASILLFLWTGFMLVDVGVVMQHELGVEPLKVGPSSWAALGALLVGVVMLGMSQQTDSSILAWLLMPPGLAATVALTPTLVARLGDTPWLAEPLWWGRRWPLLMLGGVAYVVATMAPRLVRAGPLTRGADWLVRNAARLGAALVVCWGAAAMAPQVEAVFDETSDGPLALLVVFGPLAGGLWASYVHDVVSLHRPYRDRLARCFAVRRGQTGSDIESLKPATVARLSDLAPGAHPRLLVCATTVVRVGRKQAVPFVFSHDRSGLAGVPNASFETAKLEMGKARASVMGRTVEPEMSLFGAVAMTGAAFAPMMGTMTLTGARPLAALLNARLGVWLPNPLSPARREIVDMRPARPPRWSYKRNEHGKLGPGFSAVLGEVFGTQGSRSKRVYVTDGGHYDNLGLLALLRARCAEIWCVDAYNNKKRLARQLTRVMALAFDELGVVIELGDDPPFTERPFVVGRIVYPGMAPNETATLVVVKSSLCATTPEHFEFYRRRDRAFPHHSTAVQWFSKDRVEMYRALGDQQATEALAARAGEA